jgi:hypothetical protein
MSSIFFRRVVRALSGRRNQREAVAGRPMMSETALFGRAFSNSAFWPSGWVTEILTSDTARFVFRGIESLRCY